VPNADLAAQVDWLPLLLALAAAVLFERGSRRRPAGGSLRGRRPWSGSLFAAGLLAAVLAIEPPLHTLADRHLWAHMVQHLVLLLVAAPLLVMSAPWIPLWRGLPLRMRRPLARTVAQAPALEPVRAAGRLLLRPAGAWVAFNLNLLVWHLPPLFDLTGRSAVAHSLEHTLFLLTALAFWAQVLPSWPLRRRLGVGGRAVYVLLGSTVSWALAVTLAFAPHPLYAAYAAGSGGLTGLADQRLAAGIMWVPGSIPFALVLLWDVALFLGRESPPTQRLAPH
jgi:cytochrome c oxidase assembly factor CtaG